MMPRRSASASAAVRSCTLNFRKMLLMCALAVSPLMPEGCRNLLVPLPRRQQLEHLGLPERQRGLARPLFEDCRNLRRDGALAGVDVPDDANQVIGQRVLQEVAHRSRGDRAEDVLVAVVHRQNHDPGIRLVAADRLNRLHAVHGRHLEIHQRHVGPIPEELLDRLFTIGGLCHNRHVRLDADDAGDALAHQAVVVDTEDANCSWTSRITPLPSVPTPRSSCRRQGC